MWTFSALCDEFFVSTRLRFKLDLVPSRESVLHFFEQIRRRHPEVARFRRREDGGLVLDQEQPSDHGRRFLRLDHDALKVGVCRPDAPETVGDFATTVLDLAPTHLSLSDLDHDHIEMVFGFDFEYAGNHDELVAETLFSDHPLLGALSGPEHRVIDFQPFLGVALNDECDLQAYLELKSRTSAYEVRCGDFDRSALSVYLTLRRYWSGTLDITLPRLHKQMLQVATDLAENRVVPTIIQPLATEIASRS